MAEEAKIKEIKVKRPRKKRRNTLRPMEFLYQQIYDTNSNVVLGYDASLYFNDKKLGTLSYDSISGICDRNNLANRVGKWQITELCEMLVRKRDAGKKIHRVFVTLSAKYVSKPKFIEEYKKILDKYEVPYHRFCVQIRENELAGAPKELFDNLAALRKIESRVAVTEFGAESSLLKFPQLQTDYIKLSPAFAQDITTDARAADVTESIVELADKLGYLLIADGIDTREQLAVVNRMRCFLVEGRHFSVPEREDEAIF